MQVCSCQYCQLQIITIIILILIIINYCITSVVANDNADWLHFFSLLSDIEGGKGTGGESIYGPLFEGKLLQLVDVAYHAPLSNKG